MIVIYYTSTHRLLLFCTDDFMQKGLKSFSNVCFRKDGKRRDVNNPDGSRFSSAGKWSNPDVMIISELSQSGSWDSTAMSPILQASSCKEQFQESTDKEDNIPKWTMGKPLFHWRNDNFNRGEETSGCMCSSGLLYTKQSSCSRLHLYFRRKTKNSMGL